MHTARMFGDDPDDVTTPTAIRAAFGFLGFAAASPFFAMLALHGPRRSGSDGFELIGAMILWLVLGIIATLIGVVCTVVGVRQGARGWPTRIAKIACGVLIVGSLFVGAFLS